MNGDLEGALGHAIGDDAITRLKAAEHNDLAIEALAEGHDAKSRDALFVHSENVAHTLPLPTGGCGDLDSAFIACLEQGPSEHAGLGA